MNKLFCYVDESGQDTMGKLFVVSIVVVGSEYPELEKLCLKLELESGKRQQKWHGSKRENRLKYIDNVIASDKFTNKLHYSMFSDISTKDFDFHTIVSIAETIHAEQNSEILSSEIFVDGLSKSKQPQYAIHLRKLGIKNGRIHRATDKNNVLIRLADTLAGFVRDYYEKADKEVIRIFEKGIRNKTIVKN